jgi:hypothetical integral membrane protein (TIGR02206 family)
MLETWIVRPGDVPDWLRSLLFLREPFQAGSPSHLAVLALSLLLAPLLVRLGRRGSGCAVNRVLARALAVAIFAAEVAFCLFYIPLGEFRVTFSLPLQLCDVTAFVTAWALWSGAAWAVEIACFLGLSSTLLTTLTPDLARDFPHVEFVCFFLTHALVAVGAAYMVFGLGWMPAAGATRRVLLAVNAYGLAMCAVNAALGSNYLYICRKPPVASPIDWMGPWPLYVLVLDVALVAALATLALVFARCGPAATAPAGPSVAARAHPLAEAVDDDPVARARVRDERLHDDPALRAGRVNQHATVDGDPLVAGEEAQTAVGAADEDHTTDSRHAAEVVGREPGGRTVGELDGSRPVDRHRL